MNNLDNIQNVPHIEAPKLIRQELREFREKESGILESVDRLCQAINTHLDIDEDEEIKWDEL